MTLYMVGLGLYDLADITLRGLEIVRKCQTIYLEHYTAILHTSKEELEAFFNKPIILATRELVERSGASIVAQAANSDVAFLVVGDPFGATTHSDLFLTARKAKVHIEVVHNASIMSAVGVVGLELYKYGKTTSLVFPDEGWLPQTPLEVIHDNLANDMHTLVLLDIKVAESSKEDLKKGVHRPLPPRFMTIREGIEVLQKLQEEAGEDVIDQEKIIIGVARIGACNGEPKIVAGTLSTLKEEEFGKPMHSLIIPAGKLHHIEEEMLGQWRPR